MDADQQGTCSCSRPTRDRAHEHALNTSRSQHRARRHRSLAPTRVCAATRARPSPMPCLRLAFSLLHVPPFVRTASSLSAGPSSATTISITGCRPRAVTAGRRSSTGSCRSRGSPVHIWRWAASMACVSSRSRACPPRAVNQGGRSRWWCPTWIVETTGTLDLGTTTLTRSENKLKTSGRV